MKTQVIMKRELFGHEISQQSDTTFFSATDLVKAGNRFRAMNGMQLFQLPQYFALKSTSEFLGELENKYGKVMTSARGRNGHTWVHPLLFIDIALAINPSLKVEVYEWLFDNLIKFRNDSGDSYREMCGALYTRFGNKKEFPDFISKVADYIKKTLGVESWETASEEKLKIRDKIHDSIKTLCVVLTNPREAVRIGIEENIKKLK